MSESPLSHRAAALAGALPPLLVAAERVAATVAQGVHGRRRIGSGDSFWQFRAYAPGDTAARIDWRQTAKSQRAYIRETEWEAAQSVWLWVDRSPSMDWRSARTLPTKAERAALIALALASLLARGGELVALLGDGHRPGSGRGVLQRLATELERAAPADHDGAPAPVPLPREAGLVLLGDMLGPIESMRRAVLGFAERGVRGHLVQILDPAEETLPFEGRVRFEGLEREPSALISRVEAIRQPYVERLQAHRAALSDLARDCGWRFAVHHTDRPPQSALLALHGAMSEPRR